MAGESPDKSERERSSGETTENPETVPSARQDPAEPDGADGAGGADRDARLRAAVAAWVAADGADGDVRAAEGAAGGGGDAPAATSDLPVRTPARPASGDAEATADQPTTMFGVVREDAGEPEGGAAATSAVERAERLTSAFFGARRGEDDAEDDGEESAPSERTAGNPPAAPEPSSDARASRAASEDDATASAADTDSGSGDAEAPAEERREASARAEEAAEAGSRPTVAEERPVEARPDAGSGAAEGRSETSPDAPEGTGALRSRRSAAQATQAPATRDAGGTDEAAVPPGSSAGTAAPAEVESGEEAGDAASSAEDDEVSGSADAAASPKDGEEPAAGSATPQDAVASGPRPAGAEKAPRGAERPRGGAGADEAQASPGARTAKAGGGAAQGRDQDTAMLRTPRAPRRDAPTTAIRLPAEGDSRFVPLRSSDDDREPAEPALAEGERTRQQPAPAAEPLDLLAQLTNTPPPPETPLRTTVRRFKIWTPLVVLLGIVFVVAQAVRPLPEPSLTLTAAQSHTFDGSKPSLPWPGEGQAYVDVPGLGVLGEYGEAKPVPIGSVAKTMTAYLVLKKSPLKKGDDGPMITIDAKAEEGGTHGQGNGGESVLDTVHAGQQISERDALSALMIPSANNIARLLARWYTGGSEAAFVEKMNEAADALGMDDTTYTDPSGLKHSTVSTAKDQVKLGRQVVQLPELMKITSKPHWTDPSGKTWRNWNTLVPFNGAIGIKTGTTTAAGGNLLFAGTKDIGGTTQVIVAAVLGQHKPPIIDTVNAVSRQILIAAGDTLQTETVVRKGQVVGYVDDQLGGRTPVVATKDVTAVGWAGLRVSLGLETGDKPIPHTAQAGDTVGVLTVGDGPGQVRVPVALQEDLKEPGFGDKLTRVL